MKRNNRLTIPESISSLSSYVAIFYAQQTVGPTSA